MTDITKWMEDFAEAVKAAFGERVVFIGLQGSRGRGEAGPDSDIDTVVIFDRLDMETLAAYEKVLDGLPDRKLVCGFVSGREELLCWEPSDLFQFYFDTSPVFGSLDELKPLLTEEAAARAVKTAACNIYHGCIHNVLHEKEPEILKALYISAVFAVQTLHYRKTGVYIKKHADLRDAVSGEELEIMETAEAFRAGKMPSSPGDFETASWRLISWARKQIVS